MHEKGGRREAKVGGKGRMRVDVIVIAHVSVRFIARCDARRTEKINDQNSFPQKIVKDIMG